MPTPDHLGGVALADDVKFETYQNNEYTLKGTDKKVGAKTGELRSFTANGIAYSATWSSGGSAGSPAFLGYQDEKGNQFRGFLYTWGDDGMSNWERTFSVLKKINPFSEGEAYVSAQIKVTSQKDGDLIKAVSPFGVQGVYSSKGFDTRWIGPFDSYVNVRNDRFFLDIRYMPGKTDFASGDLVSSRALITIPGLTRGIYKTQLDLATSDITKLSFNNLRIGVRGVFESPVNLKLPFSSMSYSIELNYGVRSKINPYSFKNLFRNKKQ